MHADLGVPSEIQTNDVDVVAASTPFPQENDNCDVNEGEVPSKKKKDLQITTGSEFLSRRIFETVNSRSLEAPNPWLLESQTLELFSFWIIVDDPR